MILNIEISLLQGGHCEAYCPETGLSASGCSLEEALDKMRNLLVFYISTAQDVGIDVVDRKRLLKELNQVFKDKNFLLPQRPKIH